MTPINALFDKVGIGVTHLTSESSLLKRVLGCGGSAFYLDQTYLRRPIFSQVLKGKNC